MWVLYIIFTLFCCFVTYRVTCYQIIKLNETNIKGFDVHQKYISKSLDEIALIKTDVIQIKKDIYQ